MINRKSSSIKGMINTKINHFLIVLSTISIRAPYFTNNLHDFKASFLSLLEFYCFISKKIEQFFHLK